MKVAIIGSCVTRDAFELPRSPGILLDAYFARSSLASACSDKPFEGVDTGSIESPFQRRVVGFDLEKSFLPYLQEAAFDLLIYDPIDERFALLEKDSALATRSNEFLRSSFADESTRVIDPETPEFLRLWERGWQRMLSVLDARGLRDALRVNEVYWATTAAGGPADLSLAASPRRTRSANEFLSLLYRRMNEDLRESQFFRYDSAVLVASADHKWGVSPFHYVSEFYQALVRHLELERGQRADRPAETEEEGAVASGDPESSGASDSGSH